MRRRRRAVARSGVGADARVRRPPPAGGAGRDRVRRARAGRGAPARARAGGPRPARRRRPRAARLGGAVHARRARPRPDHRGDAGQPAGAARAAARADGDAAGRRVRGPGGARGLRAGSRRASSAGSRPLPDDTRRPAAGRRGRAGRRSAAALARGRTARHRRRPRPTRRRRAARDRRARDVPPSAGALGHLPVGERPRSAGRSTWRWRRRPTGRPTRTAARGIWPPRRPGPTRRSRSELERSAGRAQARGGLAAAAAFLQRAVALTGDPARRADRALAAAEASLQAGAFDAARGLLAAAEAGPLDELQRARAGPAARRGRVLREPRQRGPGRCSCAAAKTLEPLDPRLARDDLSRRVELRRCSPGSSRPPAACTTSRARRWPAPRPDGAPRPSRPAARRIRPRVHRRPRRGGAGRSRGRSTALRGPGRLGRGGPPLGLARDRGGRDGVGLRDVPRGRRRAAVELAREAGALSVLAVSVNVMTPGRRARRRVRRRPRCWSSEARASPRRRARTSRPYGALVLAGLQGREAAAAGLIDRHDPRLHGRRAGHRGPVRALGEVAAPQRPWPLRGGARRGRGGERRHAGAVHRRRGRRSSCSRPRRGADTPSVAERALERILAATRGRRHRLGARHPRAVPRAAERGRGRRARIPRGDRAAGTHAAAPRARPHAPALRRVAAPRAPARRRPRAPARRARPARGDRHGGVRRARAAASSWRRARRCASAPSRRATS